MFPIYPYLSISIHIYPYLSYISQIYTLIYIYIHTNIIYTSNEIHKSSPALAQGSVLGISLSSCEPRKSAKPRPRNGRIYEGSTKDLPSPCSWDYNGPKWDNDDLMVYTSMIWDSYGEIHHQLDSSAVYVWDPPSSNFSQCYGRYGLLVRGFTKCRNGGFPIAIFNYQKLYFHHLGSRKVEVSSNHNGDVMGM